jgi:hyperosmotically inducible periplasmic protein
MFKKTFLWIAALSLLTLSMGAAFQRAAFAEDLPKDMMRFEGYRKMLADSIRHHLVTLPYYDVFDWLEAEVRPDGQVVVRGEVVKATTSDDAIRRVRKIDGVANVINEIKILPLGNSDAELRVALYRAIYDWDSPLFRYAMRAMPPIRIIVENRRVTLKGFVGTNLERQFAGTAARNTPGTLEVRNQLQVDGE